MKQLLALLLATVLTSAALPTVVGGQLPTATASAGPEVRLVFLIVVDQFRFDYLERFRTEYVGGIKRLLDGGAVFTNANLEHYPTVTAVGHATMLSGATPAVSGIIGNDWFDRDSGRTITSVSDATVTPVGSASAAAASPRRLLVSTVGDELKMASPFSAGSPDAPRVYGVSLKDRSAILAVGRGADAAYWWDARTGRFATSSYYARALPKWAESFNARKSADAHAGTAWTMLSPPSTVLRQFPIDAGPALYEAVYNSPAGNEVLVDFVAQLLRQERLGARKATDLLSVSFSSNDAVGHTYGPDSPQVKDISLRVDWAIGRLLDQIDATIGLRNTLVAFTSDHGIAPVPEVQRERGLPGGRMTTNELFDPVRRALTARFGEGSWLLATAGSSPYLNYDLIETRRLDATEVRRVAAAAAVTVPHVARVYTRDQLLRGAVPGDRVGSRILRSFNAQRSGDLEILLEPYWMRQAQGTTHGTPYSYDAHIPLILMGGRVSRGVYAHHVALNDLAPTLATLVGVAMPAGSEGRVLTEALDRSPAVVAR